MLGTKTDFKLNQNWHCLLDFNGHYCWINYLADNSESMLQASIWNFLKMLMLINGT